MNQSAPVDYDPFRDGELAARVPTSPQEEVWVAAKLGGVDANLCFNEGVELRVRGPLDSDALALCFQEVVARHESLRLSFLDDGSGFTVQPAAGPDLHCVDVSELAPSARDAELARRLEEQTSTPFDLERGPMIRVDLLRFGPDDHRLLLSTHHIACDGRSAGNLLKELAELYSARVTGRASALPPPVSYTTYAAAQRAREASPEGQADLAFWLEHLRGHSEDLVLPTDRPRPAQRTYRARRYDHVVDPALVQRMRKYAGRARCTAKVVMTAALNALLHRLTRQTDLVLGIPSAGQVSAGLPDLVGHCVHMLPVRCLIDPAAPFAEFLQHVRAQFTDAVEHAQVSFSSVLKRLQRPLDPSRVPLVPVTFNLDHGVGKLPFEGLDVDYAIVARPVETFELTINAPLHGDHLELQCAHNADLFDEATIASWMRCLERILDQVVETDGRIPVADLELLGLADRDAARENAWGPRQDLEPHRPVEARIAELAAAQPDALAVLASGESVTYGALNASANRVARWLSAKGVARGDRVGVCMRRRSSLPGVLVGVWRAGAAYVPLDPHLPAARLLQIVEDAGATLILTEEDLVSQLPPDARTCVLDAAAAELNALDDAPLPLDLQGQDPAYVLFTSGSTGRPKGVVVPHAALENLLTSMQAQPGFDPSDRLLAVTTISFDIAGLELFLPLISGGSLVLATRADAGDPAALQRLMAEHDVTVLQATPATWRMLLDWGWTGRPGLKVLCGGEPFPLELAEPLLRGCAEVWNLYGPTETTIWSTVKKLEPGAPITIGRPLHNTSTYVLDENMRLLPPGAPGELWIGGQGVALGYLGRPELTAERFVESPFQAGDRLYRTGDLVVQRQDGDLDCLGRLDLQVKIRGFRVELGDVEAALASFPGVQAGVVHTHLAGPGDVRLVAYVVSEDAATPDASALRAWLQERLPPYAVPALVIPLDALPLSPAGKVDRRQLPAPSPALLAGDGSERESAANRPATPTEERVVALWAELLGREHVGRHDDFFALGGHSLLAIRATSRLGVSISLLFKHPTPASLAQAIDADQAPATPAQQVPAADPSDLRPTPPQEELWVATKLGGTDANLSFNVPVLLTINGPLDPDVLERCVQDVVDRHESLRTTFEPDGSRFTVNPRVDAVLERVDLSGLESVAQDAELARRRSEHAAAPFDLERGPLLRTVLVSLGPGAHRLIVVVHHIACDGHSAGVVLEELAELYRARIASRPPALATPTSFSGYAVLERAREASPEGQADLAFWLEHLRGHSEDVALPTDRPRPAQRTYRSRRYDHVLRPALVLRLQDYAARSQCTLPVLLSGALNALLHRLTRQTDLVVGIPSVGPIAAGLPSLVGHCVHMLPVRCLIDPEAPFADTLQHVRAQFAEAMQHAQVSFSSVLKGLRRPLDPSRVPLVPVTFNVDHGLRLDFAGIEADYELIPRVCETFELTINATLSRDHHLVLQCAHNAELYDEATVASWLRCLERILDQVVDSDGRIPIASLELLGANDRGAALDNAWGPAQELLPHRPVEARIAALAETQPDAPAVFAAGERVTYAGLDAAANRLGRWLGGHGVARGDRVGVCMRRRPDLVSVLVGVWRAGAAYVPLDPHLPPARLLQIVDDADLSLILTEEDLRAQLPDGATTAVLDAIASELAALDAAPITLDLQPQDPAYVLFTSGSTGRPKGVVVPHAALENFLTSMRSQPGFQPSDRLLAVTTISFDIAGLELFLPLISGGSLVLASRADALDPMALDRLMTEHDVTVLQATPATWRMLLESGWTGRPQLKVLCGGEPFPLELAEPLLRGCAEVWNLYGPTETTIWSTLKKLEPGGPITIGRPLHNTSAYILDEGMNLLPPGAPGELWLGGLGVALGYLGRPELTQERFVESPFRKGDRLYRTGDLVVQRQDGDLHCLGRVDLQVKIRGFRVELGDVEAALAGFPGVQAGVVHTHVAGPGDVRLVAYVVSKNGAPPNSGELRAWLQERLPPYAVPGLVIPLDALPLSPAGKVDRRQLPAPSPALLAGADSSEGPSNQPATPMEERVAAVWSEILGRERIGRHDEFFAIGGHSLLAVRMMGLLGQSVGATLPLELLLKTPTLAGLSAALEGQPASAPQSSIVEVQPEGSRAPFWIVHPVGGHVVFARRLAERISPDQPLLGLQARGLDGREPPIRSIPEMAAHYVSCMRSVQPAGPYFFGGPSFGGVVAWEMAQQLHAAGETVGLVALFDTYGPGFPHRLRLPLRVLDTARYVLELPREEGMAYVRERLERKRHSSEEFLMGRRDDTTSELEQAVREVIQANDEARARYTTRPYPGRVTLFQGIHRDRWPGRSFADPENGWGPFALGGVTVVPVDSNHQYMFDVPQIDRLAPAFSKVLSAAQG